MPPEVLSRQCGSLSMSNSNDSFDLVQTHDNLEQEWASLLANGTISNKTKILQANQSCNGQSCNGQSCKPIIDVRLGTASDSGRLSSHYFKSWLFALIMEKPFF